MSKYKNSLLLLLGVKTLTLLQENHHTAKGKDGRDDNKRHKEPEGDETDEE